MRTQIFAVLSCIILAWDAPALAQEQWEYHETVHYQENHDPQMVWLKDGRQLQVVYGTEISWEAVESWRPGRPLALLWSAQRGLALQDTASGKWITVLNGWQIHPIEKMREQCLNKNPVTMGLAECYLTEAAHWDRMSNWAYKRLQARLKPESRRALQQSQREWLKFREAQVRSIQAVYREREGSITQIHYAQRVRQVSKDQALLLNSLLED
ncbi:lysozyme inhibitor LprI family protein [Massilia sp. W12]|uniref:lysozyme inhibitor LprI family protein n=1 Tax=Massilia sp. W12 TaxID=3126507 RepID=UPI0030CE4D67